MNNADRMAKLAERIKTQLNRNIGKGLNAARIFLTARIREEVSVPAPRKKYLDRSGNISYRATTKATRGAPPRKVTGRLRSGISSVMIGTRRAVIGVKARSEKGFDYPKYHELKGMGKNSGQHPFLAPTVRKYKRELALIVGREITGKFYGDI